jgi:hypothetical protein
MHSQLSYTAAKLEIAERRRRAEHGRACAQPAKPHGRPRRNPLVRLMSLRPRPLASARPR